jgi:chromosome segregation ATPase
VSFSVHYPQPAPSKPQRIERRTDTNPLPPAAPHGDGIESLLQDLLEKMNGQANDIRALKSSNTEFVSKVNGLTTSNTKFISSNLKLTSNNAELTSKVDELTSKVDKLTSLNDELKSKVNGLTSSNTDLLEKVHNLTASNRDISSTLLSVSLQFFGLMLQLAQSALGSIQEHSMP